MSHFSTTVSAPGWAASSMSGSGINGHMITSTRHFDGHMKFLKPACYGTLCKTSDEASAFNLAQGFAIQAFARPNAFIDLRLSPRTRRFLREQPRATFWFWLEKIVGDRASGEYFRSVKAKSYMDGTRQRWEAAVFTLGGTRKPKTLAQLGDEARAKREAMLATPVKGKRSIRTTAWGNTFGYAGRRKVLEFTDKAEAELWLAGGVK